MSPESERISRRHLIQAAVIASGLGAGALGRLEQRHLQAAIARGDRESSAGSLVVDVLVTTPEAGWVLPRALSPSQAGKPRAQGGLQGDSAFGPDASLEGSPPWHATYEIVMQSAAAVRIINIRPSALKRSSPLTGTLLWDPELISTQALRSYRSRPITTVSAANPSGEVLAIGAKLNLDAKSPVLIAASNGRPFFEEYTITLNPGHSFTLNLIVETVKYFAEFGLSLDLLEAGSLPAIALRPGIPPLTVTAGAGIWRSPAQPDFAAYSSLYVAAGPSVNPQWVAHNPQDYTLPAQSQNSPGSH
jgi:hypothetical protein